MDRENPFFDNRVAPHLRQKGVLRDEVAGVPKEHDQDVMGFRREANDLSFLGEPPLGGLQPELAETKDVAAVHDDFGES